MTSGSRLPGQAQARRLWLPWRPRLRLIYACPRALACVEGGLQRFDPRVGHRFTGWLRPVIAGIFLLPFLFRAPDRVGPGRRR